NGPERRSEAQSQPDHVTRAGLTILPLQTAPHVGLVRFLGVPCFCRVGGIYSTFTLKRSNGRVGASPLFCWRRAECSADRQRSWSLRLNLDKIRDAAERVARSEGLEVVDVEWKVGKQRFLPVYIGRVPPPAGDGSDSRRAG